MKAKEPKLPGWALWIADHGYWGFVVVVSLLALAAGAAYYVDRRIEGIERQLDYHPPRHYQPPDLANYQADQVAADAIHTAQTVYVPIYSHVYYQQGRPYPLEATLSIRNTDPEAPMYVRSVRYYDTDGTLSHTEVERPIKLKPLQTIEFLVEARDSSGGSGANFVVEWFSTRQVASPIVAAVMVGTNGTQGISFHVNGTVVRSNGAAVGAKP